MITLDRQPEILVKFVFLPDRRRGVGQVAHIDESIDIRSFQRASLNRQRLCTGAVIVAQIIAKSPKIGLVPDDIFGLIACQLHSLATERKCSSTSASDDHRCKHPY